MKNKLIAVGLIAGMSLFNSALAADLVPPSATVTTKDQVLAMAPIYLMVEIGQKSVCDANNEYLVACKLTTSPEANVEYAGSIQAVEGTMTVAKEILIGSDETLDNSVHNTGVASSEIDFDFKTPFYKGMILKVQPNADYSETEGKLSFSMKVDGQLKNIADIPFDKLADNSIETGSNGLRIQPVVFAPGSNLTARNAAFYNKLYIAEKLQGVIRWARAMYLAGKISADLYSSFDALADNSWLGNYDETGYFQWRYNRLKANINNSKVTPALFFGGLNLLMKHITK